MKLDRKNFRTTNHIDGGKHEPCRSSSEVLAMFRDYFCSAASLSSALRRGKFPAPEMKTGISCSGKLYWKLSTLEKELKARKLADKEVLV